MMILKEFSRIVCVSLFSYQGSLFLTAFRQLVHFIIFINVCQALFSSFFETFSYDLSLVQATCPLYHIINSLSTTFFVFSKLFKLCVQKNQFFVTAQLEYHVPTGLSTLFSSFFQKPSPVSPKRCPGQFCSFL